MRNHPVVFRLQEPTPRVEKTRDYESCRGYGEMRTILSHRQNPSTETTTCGQILIEALSEVQEGDFILWCGGDPMTSFLAGVILSSLGKSHMVKWLRWDRRTNSQGNRTSFGYYVPVEIAR